MTKVKINSKNKTKSGAKKSLLCLSLAGVLMLGSCAASSSDYVLYGRYPNGKIRAYMTDGMFRYFLAQQKSTYLQVLMYNDKSITGDSPEVWQALSPDGRTYEEVFFEDVVSEATELVAANYLLYSFTSTSDPNKEYTLPEDYLDYVDALIAQNAVENYGSLDDFEDYLLNFGATLRDYTDLYIMTANVDLLKDAVFSDGGIAPITDERIKAYYAENYYSVKHVFINTAYDEKIDGTKAPLSDAEQKKRSETADRILAFVKSGGSFDEIGTRFSESYVTAYSGVNTMDCTAQTTNAPELGEALKTMEVGEVRSVASQYGIHILKRVETDPETYKDNESTVSAITASLKNALYPEIIALYTSQITVDEEKLSEYSLASAVLP